MREQSQPHMAGTISDAKNETVVRQKIKLFLYLIMRNSMKIYCDVVV